MFQSLPNKFTAGVALAVAFPAVASFAVSAVSAVSAVFVVSTAPDVVEVSDASAVFEIEGSRR
ncbi:MAG: hypothetical protein ACREUM_02600, partial [Nitrosospira sp.]